MNKYKLFGATLSLAGIIGLLFLDWKIMLFVFLLVWGNNIERSL